MADDNFTKKISSDNFSDSSSSRSSDEMKAVELKSIKPKSQSIKIDRSTPELFIKDVTKMIPESVYTQCKMKREKRGIFGAYNYKLYGDDKIPIFTASTESTPFSTKYSIMEPSSAEIIGTIESNCTSLIYNVKGPDVEFKVIYDENFLGRHGARSFIVQFPNKTTYILKPPIAINGKYYQDFHNMDLVDSIKNFICVSQDDFTKEVCIFTRRSENRFTLRVMRPFSIFVGFAIALTSLHTGIFHR